MAVGTGNVLDYFISRWSGNCRPFTVKLLAACNNFVENNYNELNAINSRNFMMR